jgi:TrmH family RNA methyltransferase
VRPYDVAFREAKSAVGAPDLLKNAEVFASVEAAIADCSLVVGTSAVGSRQIEIPVQSLENGGSMLRAHLETGRLGLLFGSEKRGLSNDDLSYCHWLMRIPTRAEHISMNLGQAVAVCLYELIRATDEPRDGQANLSAKAAVSEELDRMTRALLETLAASGYIKPGTEAATEEKTRRLVRRLQLTSADAETMTGMFAKMFKAGNRG